MVIRRLPLEPIKPSLRGYGEFCAADFRRPAGKYPRIGPFETETVLNQLFAAVTLPMWGPLVGLLWAIIKIRDPSQPAFFFQVRAGYLGRPFRIVKLRTMVPDAHLMMRELLHANMTPDSQHDFKMANDPRVTKLGKLLRATHLDELPQMWNVLVGEMHLVGPRPSSVPVLMYEPWMKERLRIRPGLTGLAQVHRSTVHGFEERTRLDIRYVRYRSLGFDLCLIVRTVAVAFLHRRGL